MEEVFQSISQKQWTTFLQKNPAKQKWWLKRYFLSAATDVYSALVLNKAKTLVITKKDVKAIMGQLFPEALASYLGHQEMLHNEVVQKFNRLIIRKVTNKIQLSNEGLSLSKDSLIRRSADKLVNVVEQTQLYRKIQRRKSSTPDASQLNPITTNYQPKGKHGIYNKYRRGREWLLEGIPKLPNIPEASQEEEMLAEIHHFGFTIQGHTEEFLKTLAGEIKDIPPSVDRVNPQACDPSESQRSELSGTRDAGSEDDCGKEYVIKMVSLVLCEALQSSRKQCHEETFKDLNLWMCQQVLERLGGKKVKVRSRFLNLFAKSIFSQLCEAICSTEGNALSLMAQRIPTFQETIMSCFETHLVKKPKQQYGSVIRNLFRKMMCGNALKTEDMTAEGAPAEQQENLQQAEMVPEMVPEAFSASTGAATLQPLVKEVMMKMIGGVVIHFQAECIDHVCEQMSQRIWEEVQGEHIQLSQSSLEELSDAIVEDILTQWRSVGATLSNRPGHPLTTLFKVCLIERLKGAAP